VTLKVFATKWFVRFARKEKIENRRLREAIARAEAGSVDADLGGNLIKQRIGRQGKGRSGGYRTVIAYHATARSIFLYGFAKKDREDIDITDLESLKSLAKHLLMLSDAGIESALAENELTEVHDDDDEDKREIS
jgi:hypothetical protein